MIEKQEYGMEIYFQIQLPVEKLNITIQYPEIKIINNTLTNKNENAIFFKEIKDINQINLKKFIKFFEECKEILLTINQFDGLKKELKIFNAEHESVIENRNDLIYTQMGKLIQFENETKRYLNPEQPMLIRSIYYDSHHKIKLNFGFVGNLNENKKILTP